MRHRGVTLIELLISIAIIGLLIGILLPAVGYARRMGQDAACKSNLSQIAKCFYLYAEAHNGSAPDENSPISWDEQLKPFIPDKAIYQCPGDKSRIGRAMGLSYSWRNGYEATSPRGNICKVNFLAASPGDLILVFDMKFNWHRYDTLNGSMLGTSAHDFTSDQFYDDMDRIFQ